MRALNSQRQQATTLCTIVSILIVFILDSHGANSRSVVPDDQVIEKSLQPNEQLDITLKTVDENQGVVELAEHNDAGKSTIDSGNSVKVTGDSKNQGIRRFDSNVEAQIVESNKPIVSEVIADKPAQDDIVTKIITVNDRAQDIERLIIDDSNQQKRSVQGTHDSIDDENAKINVESIDDGSEATKLIENVNVKQIPELIPVTVDHVDPYQGIVPELDNSRKSLIIAADEDNEDEREEIRNERSHDINEDEKLESPALSKVEQWKQQALVLQGQLKNNSFVQRLKEQAAEVLPDIPKFTENQLLQALKTISFKKYPSSTESYIDTMNTSMLNENELEIFKCAEGLVAQKQRQSFSENLFECIRGLSILNCMRIFIWPIIADNVPESISQNFPTLPIEITMSDWVPGSQEKSKTIRATVGVHQQRLITPELVVSNILKDALESNIHDENLPTYIDPSNETLVKLLTEGQIEILKTAEKFLPESAREEYSNSMYSCVRRFEYFSCIKYFAWPMIKQHFPALPEFPDYQSWYPSTISVYPDYPILPFTHFHNENAQLPEVVEAEAIRNRSPRPETLIAHILQNTLDQQSRQPLSSSITPLKEDAKYVTPEQLTAIQMAEQLIPEEHRAEFVEKTMECIKQHGYLPCTKYLTWPAIRQWQPQFPAFPDLGNWLGTYTTSQFPDLSSFIPQPPSLSGLIPSITIGGGASNNQGSISGSISTGGGSGGQGGGQGGGSGQIGGGGQGGGQGGGSGQTGGGGQGGGSGQIGGGGQGGGSGQIGGGGQGGNGGQIGGGSQGGSGGGSGIGGGIHWGGGGQTDGGNQGGGSGGQIGGGGSGGQIGGGGQGGSGGQIGGGGQGGSGGQIGGGSGGGIHWGSGGQIGGGSQGGSGGQIGGGSQGGSGGQIGGGSQGGSGGQIGGGSQGGSGGQIGGGSQGGINWGSGGQIGGGSQGGGQGGSGGQIGGGGSGQGGGGGGSQIGGGQIGGGGQGGSGGQIGGGGSGGQIGGGGQGSTGGGSGGHPGVIIIIPGSSGSGGTTGGGQVNTGGSGGGNINTGGSTGGGQSGAGGISWSGQGNQGGNAGQSGNTGGTGSGGISWDGQGNQSGNQGGSQGGNTGSTGTGGISWGGQGNQGGGTGQSGNIGGIGGGTSGGGGGGISWGGQGNQGGNAGSNQPGNAGSGWSGQGNQGTTSGGTQTGSGGSSITIIVPPNSQITTKPHPDNQWSGTGGGQIGAGGSSAVNPSGNQPGSGGTYGIQWGGNSQIGTGGSGSGSIGSSGNIAPGNQWGSPDSGQGSTGGGISGSGSSSGGIPSGSIGGQGSANVSPGSSQPGSGGNYAPGNQWGSPGGGPGTIGGGATGGGIPIGPSGGQSNAPIYPGSNQPGTGGNYAPGNQWGGTGSGQIGSGGSPSTGGQIGGSAYPSSGNQPTSPGFPSTGGQTTSPGFPSTGSQIGGSGYPSSGNQPSSPGFPSTGGQIGGSGYPGSGNQPSSPGLPSTGGQIGGSGYPSSGNQPTSPGFPSTGGQIGGSGYPSTGGQIGGSGYPSSGNQPTSPGFPSTGGQIGGSGYPSSGNQPSSPGFPSTGGQTTSPGFPSTGSQIGGSGYPSSGNQPTSPGFPSTGGQIGGSGYPGSGNQPSSPGLPSTGGQIGGSGYPSSGNQPTSPGFPSTGGQISGSGYPSSGNQPSSPGFPSTGGQTASPGLPSTGGQIGGSGYPSSGNQPTSPGFPSTGGQIGGSGYPSSGNQPSSPGLPSTGGQIGGSGYPSSGNQPTSPGFPSTGGQIGGSGYPSSGNQPSSPGVPSTGGQVGGSGYPNSGNQPTSPGFPSTGGQIGGSGYPSSGNQPSSPGFPSTGGQVGGSGYPSSGNQPTSPGFPSTGGQIGGSGYPSSGNQPSSPGFPSTGGQIGGSGYPSSGNQPSSPGFPSTGGQIGGSGYPSSGNQPSSPGFPSTGGQIGGSGYPSSGNQPSSPGFPSTGGQTTSPGLPSTGGQTTSPGLPSTGGQIGGSGYPSSGNQPTSPGFPSTGGQIGGSGYPSSGNQPSSPGFPSTGGQTTSPGLPSTGGQTTSPGLPSTGGQIGGSGYPSSGNQPTSPGFPSTGGQIGGSGYPSSGNQPSSPGFPSTGGQTTSPGLPSTGGQTTSPGLPSTGGQIGGSGYPSSGNQPTSPGFPSTGGQIGGSGYPSSGNPPSSSGFPSTGGQTGSGGSLSTGGQISSPGFPSTGGIPSTGGQIGGSGIPNTGDQSTPGSSIGGYPGSTGTSAPQQPDIGSGQIGTGGAPSGNGMTGPMIPTPSDNQTGGGSPGGQIGGSSSGMPNGQGTIGGSSGPTGSDNNVGGSGGTNTGTSPGMSPGGEGGINTGQPGSISGGDENVPLCPCTSPSSNDSPQSLKQLEPYVTDILSNLHYPSHHSPLRMPYGHDKHSSLWSRLTKEQLTIMGLATNLTPHPGRRDLLSRSLGCMQGGAEFMVCAREVIWPYLGLYLNNIPEFPNDQSKLYSPKRHTASPYQHFIPQGHVPNARLSTQSFVTQPFQVNPAGLVSLFAEPDIQIESRTPLQSSISAKANDEPLISVTGTRFVPIFSDQPTAVILDILNTVSKSTAQQEKEEYSSRIPEFMALLNSTLSEQQERIMKLAENLLPAAIRANMFDDMFTCLRADNDFMSCTRDIIWPKLSEYFPRLPSFPNFQQLRNVDNTSEDLQPLNEDSAAISETDVKTGHHGDAMVTITDTRFVPIYNDHPEEVILKLVTNLKMSTPSQQTDPSTFIVQSPPFATAFTNQQSKILSVAENLIPGSFRVAFIERMSDCVRANNFLDCTRDVVWPVIGQFFPRLSTYPNFGGLPSISEGIPQQPTLLPPHPESNDFSRIIAPAENQIHQIPQSSSYATQFAAASDFSPLAQLQLSQHAQPFRAFQASPVQPHGALFPGITSSVGTPTVVPGFPGQPTEILIDISQERVPEINSIHTVRNRRSAIELIENETKSQNNENTVNSLNQVNEPNAASNLTEPDIMKLLVNVTKSKLDSEIEKPEPILAESLNSSAIEMLTPDQIEILKMVEKIGIQNAKGIVSQVIQCVSGLSFIRCIGIFVLPLLTSALPTFSLPFGRSEYKANIGGLFNQKSMNVVEKELLAEKESVENILIDWYKHLTEEKYSTNYGFLKFEGHGNGEIGVKFTGFRRARGLKIKDNKNLPSILTIISDIMEDVLDTKPEQNKPKKDKKSKSIQFQSDEIPAGSEESRQRSDDDKVIKMFLEKFKPNNTTGYGEDENRYLTVDDAYRAFEVLFGTKMRARFINGLESFYQMSDANGVNEPNEEVKVVPLDSDENKLNHIDQKEEKQKLYHNNHRNRIENVDAEKSKVALVFQLPRLHENVEIAGKITSSITSLSRHMKNNMQQMMPGIGFVVTMFLQMALAHARAAASVAGLISNMALGSAVMTLVRQSFFPSMTEPKIKHVYVNEPASNPAMNWAQD